MIPTHRKFRSLETAVRAFGKRLDVFAIRGNPHSQPARCHDNDTRMFRKFDCGVEGTHQAVFNHPSNGEGVADLAGKMGFKRGEGGIRRELWRGQWRLGGNLFILRFSLIGFGSGYKVCLLIGGDDENGGIVHVVKDVGDVFLAIISPNDPDATMTIRSTKLSAVLLIAHLLHPIHSDAVEFLLNGDVRHRGCDCRPMPVLFAGREPNHIAGTDFLNWSAFALRPAAAGRHDQRLTERVRMPRGTRTRLERDAGPGNTRWFRDINQRINPHRAGEPICRPFTGRPRTNSLDLHFIFSFE
jgi:hypothetical protein